MKGHVLAMKLDTSAVVRQLPLAVETVPFRVLISPSYTEAQRAHALKQYVVRPQQLRQLLVWAKAHNPYFKDVAIDDALLASLPDSSVPASIVRVSDLADSRSEVPPAPAAKATHSSSTSFHVQTRVLDTMEKLAVCETKTRQPPTDASPSAGVSAAAPALTSSTDTTSTSSSPVPTCPAAAKAATHHTADALDDDAVHYNAMLRVSAPVVDTGDFLREAAAAAPTYPTSPPRPRAPPNPDAASAPASSPSSSSSLTDTASNPRPAITLPVSPDVPSPHSASASASSSSAIASMLAFPPAPAAPVSRALYHVQPTAPVWENEKDWFRTCLLSVFVPFWPWRTYGVPAYARLTR